MLWGSVACKNLPPRLTPTYGPWNLCFTCWRTATPLRSSINWEGQANPSLQEPDSSSSSSGTELGPVPAVQSEEKVQWQSIWEFQDGGRLPWASKLGGRSLTWSACQRSTIALLSLRPRNLAATCLKSLELRSRAKTRGPWLEKRVPSLEKNILSKEGRPLVSIFNAVGPTKGL